eukprot:3640884-Prymnesium_polylepis.1
MRSSRAISRPSAPSRRGSTSSACVSHSTRPGFSGGLPDGQPYRHRMLMYRTLLPAVRAGSSVLTATELTPWAPPRDYA